MLLNSTQTVEPILVCSRDAARILSIGERTLFTLMKDGTIPHVRIGRSVRYAVADLHAYIEARKRYPTKKPLHEEIS